MKYSSQLGPNDIDYATIKQHILDSTAAEYVDRVCKSASSIPSDPESTKRNFLGCLKLFKKFEKQRRELIPRSMVHLIYDVPAFKNQEKELRDSYERRYPQYAKSCHVLIIGHRAFEPYPASKLSGFTLRYRPDYVEIDVCLCKSGQVLLQHDRFLADGQPVEECNLDDLSGAVVLRDLLKQLKGQDVPKLMIDMNGSEAPLRGRCGSTYAKGAPYSKSADLVLAIKRDLETLSWNLDKVLMASFNMHHLFHLSELLPQVSRALLTSNVALDSHLPLLQKVGCDLIIIDENTISRDLVAGYKEHGIDVWCFTVNSIGRLSAIAGMGVSGLITDYPNMLL